MTADQTERIDTDLALAILGGAWPDSRRDAALDVVRVALDAFQAVNSDLERENTRLRAAVTAYLEGDDDGEDRLRAAREGKGYRRVDTTPKVGGLAVWLNERM